MTVTVARALIAPQPDPIRATTVFVNVPATVPAVNTPPASMAPPPLTTSHVGAIGTTLSFASYPVAVNVCCAPIASVALGGDIVMYSSGPARTVTDAVPEIDPLVA